MKGLPYNLHSHTFRCGHAYGEDEEYVLHAIANGYKLMAFTDHVFLPGISHPGIRGDYDQYFDDYVQAVLNLKEKYKDQIEILLGFECEWYHDAFASYYRDLKQSKGFQVLGLGQHCVLMNGMLQWYSLFPNQREARTRYKEDLIAGMESGLFDYVCHPDLYVYATSGGWDEQCEEIARAIVKKAIELDIPLEINAAPSRGYTSERLREGVLLRYPYDPFWDIAAQYGAKAIIGIDAHSPSDYDDTDNEFLIEYCKKRHLKLQNRVLFENGKLVFKE